MPTRKQAEADMMWMEGFDPTDCLRLMTAAQRRVLRSFGHAITWGWLVDAQRVIVIESHKLPVFITRQGHIVETKWFIRREAGVDDGE